MFNRLVVMPPLFRAVLRTPTQCIWHGILGSWPVNDLKIKAVLHKSTPGLPPVKWFVLGEPLQPTMIRIVTNLMSCTLEISTPFLEGSGNCKQFLVMYLIINLMLIHFARIKGNRVQTAFELLKKDSADCEICSVTFNNVQKFWIIVPQDWCRCKALFQLLKSAPTVI